MEVGGGSERRLDSEAQALKAAGKDYEFHMYPGAGHGFFYYNRPAYRQEQAADGWKNIWAFQSKHLGGPE